MKNPSCTSLEQKTDFPATYDTELLVLVILGSLSSLLSSVPMHVWINKLK